MEYINDTMHSRSRTRLRRTDIVTSTLGTNHFEDHFDFSGYPDGQLVRVDRGEVFYVENGQGISLNQLSGGKLSNDASNPTMINGRPYTWANVVEGGNQKSGGLINQLGQSIKALVTGGVKKVATEAAKNPEQLLKAGKQAKTLVITGGLTAATAGLAGPSLLKAGKDLVSKVKSVNAGGTPVKADVITTAVTKTPTNSVLADKILEVANSVSPQVKDAVINKGTELLTDKLGSVSRSPELLPKTQGLIDAERYVDAGGNYPVNGVQPLQSSLTMFGSTTVFMVIGAVILLIVFSKLNNS